MSRKIVRVDNAEPPAPGPRASDSCDPALGEGAPSPRSIARARSVQAHATPSAIGVSEASLRLPWRPRARRQVHMQLWSAL